MYHELDTCFLVVTGKSSGADLVTTFGLYAFLCLSIYKYILFISLFCLNINIYSFMSCLYFITFDGTESL